MGQNEKTEPKPQFELGFDWCTICTLAAREAGCSCAQRFAPIGASPLKVQVPLFFFLVHNLHFSCPRSGLFVRAALCPDRASPLKVLHSVNA